MTGIPHMPTRPVWVCIDCPPQARTEGGTPALVDWPCTPAQERILDEFGDGVALGLYIASHFVQAAEDMALDQVDGLYTRFFGWTHDRRRP